MPLLVSFFLPLLTVGLFILFFKGDFTIGEIIIFLLGSISLCLLTWIIASSLSGRSVEYLGGYVEKVTHYDEWNELVTRTRQVPAGQDDKGNTIYVTQTYTEVVEHPECWSMKPSLGKERWITEYDFDTIREKFGTDGVFVPMFRNYYTKNGDAQSYSWNGERETIVSYTREHRYRNPFKGTNSIFRYTDIDYDKAREYGLMEYPEVRGYKQKTILGFIPDDDAIDEVDYINAVYGEKCQFRLFVLVYPSDLGIETVERQKCYWRGGNKNELVVCIGVNDSLKVKWCGAFSWCDEPWLEVETRSWFAEHDTLDIRGYGIWLEKNIETKWKRKEFSDFKYLGTSTSNVVKWIVFALSVVLCFGFWILKLNDVF